MQLNANETLTLGGVASTQYSVHVSATITGTSPTAPAAFSLDVLLSGDGREKTTIRVDQVRGRGLVRVSLFVSVSVPVAVFVSFFVSTLFRAWCICPSVATVATRVLCCEPLLTMR